MQQLNGQTRMATCENTYATLCTKNCFSSIFYSMQQLCNRYSKIHFSTFHARWKWHTHCIPVAYVAIRWSYFLKPLFFTHLPCVTVCSSDIRYVYVCKMYAQICWFANDSAYQVYTSPCPGILQLHTDGVPILHMFCICLHAVNICI